MTNGNAKHAKTIAGNYITIEKHKKMNAKAVTKIEVDKTFLFMVLEKVETLEKRVAECEKVENWIVSQMKNPPQKTIFCSLWR